MKIDIATAYTIDADIYARFKEKNCIAIAPENLKKKKYDDLVLQGGSIEITNLFIKDDDDSPNWSKKIETSSLKMFKLAEEYIVANPGFEVIITERIPRFDSNDPKQLKSQLSMFANSIYCNLWVSQKYKKKYRI